MSQENSAWVPTRTLRVGLRSRKRICPSSVPSILPFAGIVTLGSRAFVAGFTKCRLPLCPEDLEHILLQPLCILGSELLRVCSPRLLSVGS